jgi:glycosyltransferase involved in cell wall biosynthesis
MRYLWDLYHDYRHDWSRSAVQRALMAPCANYLRLWDYASAARVDQFIANSRNVRHRIWKTYRREADVIYPPVDVESFFWKPAEDYYLAVSELVAYKRLDSLVRVFSRTGRRLKIAGGGPEYAALRRIAGPTIEFTGRVSDGELRELFARCRAFVQPAEEDFGITAVEAQASGKAVVALGRGGVLESVPPFGGMFYEDPDDASLAEALERFEAREGGFSPVELRQRATRFSGNEFRRAFLEVLAGDTHKSSSRVARGLEFPDRESFALEQ